MDDRGSPGANEYDERSGDEAPSGRWLPITGPLSPTRAAVLAVALERAGIAPAFIRSEEHDVFPTEFGAHRPEYQQLAVLEDQVARARAVVARVDVAYPLNAPVASEPAADDPRDDVRPAEVLPEVRVVPAVDPEEKAFEARRVRRYTEGLFVFVIGLVWTLVVLPRARSDTVLAVVGVVTLCVGLLMIYAALSLRRGGEEDGGEEGSDRSDVGARAARSESPDRSDLEA